MGQKEPFEPKKISAFAAFVAIGGRWRVPGRPDTVRDHQGPPGINILVKRNRLSKKKFGLSGLGGLLRPLEGPGETRHYQGPPGIDALVKRNRLSQKKFPASTGLWRPLEGPGGAGHRQGPSGVDPKVKRNHLNQKIFCSLCSLGDLLEAKMKAAIWWKLKVCTKTLN